jgi:hypothetical protein
VPVRAVLATLVVVGLIGSAAGYGSYSAFSATTTNSGNSFAAGTVVVDDNDAGTAMLALSDARPGGSDTSCIKVRYTGSLSSTVRLYASVSGTLASYLTLTVTRGTDSSPSFDSCAGFTADATDYNGNGAGVVYSGNLADFPASYAAGIVDPKAAAPETWTTNEEHFYKFTISLQDNNAAQGLSASAGFTWEARNE